MSQLDPTTTHASETYNDIIPYGSTTEDTLPSFSSVIGEDASAKLTPDVLSKKISAINDYYEGLESPYISAQSLMRRTLAEKREQFRKNSLNRKELKSTQLEIDELEDGLTWALKKVNILEEERKLIISGLQ